jgi:hypothetical protein
VSDAHLFFPGSSKILFEELFLERLFSHVFYSLSQPCWASLWLRHHCCNVVLDSTPMIWAMKVVICVGCIRPLSTLGNFGFAILDNDGVLVAAPVALTLKGKLGVFFRIEHASLERGQGEHEQHDLKAGF